MIRDATPHFLYRYIGLGLSSLGARWWSGIKQKICPVKNTVREVVKPTIAVSKHKQYAHDRQAEMKEILSIFSCLVFIDFEFNHCWRCSVDRLCVQAMNAKLPLVSGENFAFVEFCLCFFFIENKSKSSTTTSDVQLSNRYWRCLISFSDKPL